MRNDDKCHVQPNDTSTRVRCGHWGCRVRVERVLRGWSQARLARKANVWPATIRRIERGIGTPTEATVVAVERALGLGGRNA